MTGRREESKRTKQEIPTEILQDILVRLPTKDVIRSSCVSKLWCRIVRDPSFSKLHATDHVAEPSESEVLLVSETREPGSRDEASVFNLSSAKPMCHVTIPSGYSLANVCNGFLCFAIDYDQAPVVVCNPVTGEMQQLPKAPPLSESGEGDGHVRQLSHRFLLAFSPSTKECTMFRLSCNNNTNYIAVYTIGGRDGWRQCSYPSRFHPALLCDVPRPVHIDGNLYVPEETVGFGGERAAEMLVIDVATETRRTYHLPYNNRHSGCHTSWENGFELNGKMCLAVNVFDPRRKLQFWVMELPGETEDIDDDKLYWDLRYCFDLGGEPFSFGTPRGSAWLDHAQMLCYTYKNSLYKYDTKKGHSSSSDVGRPLLFDKQVQLPVPEAASWSDDSTLLPSCRWNICGGYRPSLLSLLTFALPPSQDDKGKQRQFERTLLRALTQI